MGAQQYESEEEEWRPHLVFLVPGINGCAEHFDHISDRLLKEWGEEIVVHACTSNNDALSDILIGDKSFLTVDGIDTGGKRIAAEVVKGIHSWNGLPPRSISFWGHSMGGLYARYAIAELMDKDGTICGLPPRLFLTTASPHIGVAGTFSKPVVAAGSAIGVLGQTGWLGKSGQQLFFEDEDRLLWRLACEDRYVDALEQFEFRALVANVCNDLVVDFCVSALQPHCPEWLQNVKPLSEEFPHVVFDSKHWDRRLDSLELDAQKFPSSRSSKQRRSRSTRAEQRPERPLARQRSQFQKGGKLNQLDDRGAQGDTSSSWYSMFFEDKVEEDVTSPAIFCSGHPEQLRIEEARLRLAAMSWRLVCMRFNDYPGQIAHNDVICKIPGWNASDGVDYITQVVMDPVFNSKCQDT